MRDFAGRLIAHEAREAGTQGTPREVFPVVEKLRPHLTTLMGNGGYRALLLRSLALATSEIPTMQAARVAADGRLEGFDGLQAGLDHEGAAEGRVIVVSRLIELLVTFIGEKLTLQMVREIWPKLSIKELNFKKED